MALQKQPIAVSFSQGLDTKTDPNQVVNGKMLQLENAVFDTLGQLRKRNGFGSLTALPTTSGVSNITTYQGNLIATGQSLQVYNSETQAWLNRGGVQPVAVSAQALVRTSNAQTSPDSVTAPSGLMCTAYSEGGNAYYRISDSVTGQSVVDKVALPATSVNPRVFLLSNYFVITFGATVAASPHLQFVAISTSTPTTANAAADITTNFSAIGDAYDAVVANNRLYVTWAGGDVGGAVRYCFVTSTLVVSAPQVLATYTPTLIAVAADNSGNTPVIYSAFVSSGQLYVTARDANLSVVLAPTSAVTSSAINHIAAIASSGKCTVVYQLTATYPSAVRSDSINQVVVTSAGVISVPGVVVALSVGLASKPFSINGVTYVLAAHQSSYQPSYFLMKLDGTIVARLAYQNGGGYASTQILPSVTVLNGAAQVPYLIKDSLQSVSKVISGTDKQIFSQTGINLATFNFAVAPQYSSEAGKSLHLTGGQLWQYDGVKPVEHNFHLWPEDVAATTATGAGGLIAQQYYYQFCYEWTDAQGLLHRSAPSLPVGVLTTTASSTNTLVVPTLRLTAKTGANAIRIVGYRWSTAQQNYFMFTSIASPVLNDTTVNTVTITDANADIAILGNTLLYTTGGVVEHTAAPACRASTLAKNRLWLVDAEDPNLLWYSKQILDATPVEMSDLLTLYVPPTTGVQGSTGDITAIATLDDKLIIFKKSAIYYVVGTGPDNTGNQNDFSDPIFISSAVGCANPASIVLTPMGLMFQSDKGIWELGRNLQTKYIGDDVEAYNSRQVVSAISVPGTNQVRFTLNNNVTLMYDYYVGQWSTFTGIPAVSSTLYNGQQTLLNSLGQVLQETPGLYVDAGLPVLMAFTTSWLKLAGLMGYQRTYSFFLLAKYISPHLLNFRVAYDYDASTAQAVQIAPTNFTANFGTDSVYGAGQFGGESTVEEWQVYLTRQKCQSIRISMQESFDASLGVAAGQGFVMSGINLMVGVKAGEPKLAPKYSAS